jgi:energy-coupling factor transporter ATP-binding protein EcfA2
MSAGARFVRADLHVHSRPDGGENRAAPVDYITAAQNAELSVLGITDHNAVEAIPGLLAAAQGTGLLVLPGIEISTNEGHLLALFAPEALETLQEFATRINLQLQADPRDGSLRSGRSMVDLVGDISERGGLAIPAHVDARDGIQDNMSSTALAQLLAHRGLAALEFTSREALTTWFSETDPDGGRRAAWQARQTIPELAGRGLARVMSSDAHSPAVVGGDRPSRTMTRLRLDEPNFEAVRNAIVFNSKARCKAEIDLPAAYPRVVSVAFEGGFLDGVVVGFSSNLNCFIGGRGSGKSTALIAMRAALGADLEGDDDPDDPDRMPEKTTVTFVDRAGNERIAVRRRGGAPEDEATGAPIALELADMGQGGSGRLARDYTQDPAGLRRFLDVFVDLGVHRERQEALFSQLEDNGAEILRASQGLGDLEHAQQEVRRLESTLKAAENSKVDQLATYAAQLVSETALLQELEAIAAALLLPGLAPVSADIPALATQTGTDLGRRPAADHVPGEDGVAQLLAALVARRADLRAHLEVELRAAGGPLLERLEGWRAQHAEWQSRMDALRRELEDQGLKVQAGEILRVSIQLNAAREKVRQLTERATQRRDAERLRKTLLDALHADRSGEHERRKATLRRVVAHVNEQAEGLRVHIAVEPDADDAMWCEWLSTKLGFRQPRVGRVARDVSPREFADALRGDRPRLEALRADGAAMLDADQVNKALSVRNYPTIFQLETMRRNDRVRIDVSEEDGQVRRPFDHLSAGQQRSVLLSLLLSADRDEPLIVDQPEDHLDASYIASSVVRQLEAAKERRQVIIATHSANLAVLGDAELVIPMYAAGGRGGPQQPGAVDRPDTRERVCQLLEGGRDAYKRRGERYGFDVRPAVR